MLITNNATPTKTTQAASLKSLLLLMTLSFLPTAHLSANDFTDTEVSTEQYTLSQGQFKKTLNEQQRKNIINTQKNASVPDQLNGKASAKTRKTILANASNPIKRAKNSLVSQSHHSNLDADFAIMTGELSSLTQDILDAFGGYASISDQTESQTSETAIPA